MTLSAASSFRKLPHHEKIGHYDIAIRLLNPVIKKGDTLNVEIYITGYGQISGAKLVFYPSSDLFQISTSKVSYDIYSKEGKLYHGNTESFISRNGTTLPLTGGQEPQDDNELPTIFVDILDSGYQISTEVRSGKAPIEFNLHTLKSVKPGQYSLDFYFTYFNGSEWSGSQQSVSFTIQNILQRHENIAASLAAFAAIVTIADGFKISYQDLITNLSSILSNNLFVVILITIYMITLSLLRNKQI